MNEYIAMYDMIRFGVTLTEITEVTDKKTDKLSLGNCSVCTYSTTQIISLSTLHRPNAKLETVTGVENSGISPKLHKMGRCRTANEQQ